MRPRSTLLPVTLVALLACARSDAVRAARSGDRTHLASILDQAQKSGTLSNGEARAIAHAVIARELKSSADQTVTRLHELAPCAPAVESLLDARARIHDRAGAEAAELLVGSGLRRPSSFDASTDDPLPGWRAIHARTLTSTSDAPARRAALLDPAPEVRRAAVAAASDADDQDLWPLLFDRARLDPDPLVRSDAVRAFSQLAPERAARKLADLFAASDDTLKMTIATEWATTLADQGGTQELMPLLAAVRGDATVLSASLWLRAHPKAQASDLLELVRTVLLEALARGSRSVRLSAIRLVPLRDEFEASLFACTTGSDREVMLHAWMRLLESPKHEARAREALRRFAGNDYGRMSAEARLELARKDDRSIQAWIEKDLLSSDGQTQLLAVRALGALGRVARAAPLLVHEDVSVRTRAACAMLEATKR